MNVSYDSSSHILVCQAREIYFAEESSSVKRSKVYCTEVKIAVSITFEVRVKRGRTMPIECGGKGVLVAK